MSCFGRTIAISQSNYIPWKGYFDLIARVDEFVLYDDAQFTRRDWRNRNQIKTAHGPQWLTIPLETKGNYLEAIKHMRVSDPEWAGRHWKAIRLGYARAPYFDLFAPSIEAMYQAASREKMLSTINHLFLRGLCDLLGIRTPLKWSMDCKIVDGKNERLISLCQQLGATHYLSGPAARSYVDEAAFQAAGIAVKWMDYSHYKPYEQQFGAFIHGVSVLDVLFNCGPHAPDFVWKGPPVNEP